MDNHQLEIFDVLEKDSYVLGFRTMAEVDKGVEKVRVFCYNNIEQIKEALEKIEKGGVKEYPLPEKNKINEVIEEMFD